MWSCILSAGLLILQALLFACCSLSPCHPNAFSHIGLLSFMQVRSAGFYILKALCTLNKCDSMWTFPFSTEGLPKTATGSKRKGNRFLYPQCPHAYSICLMLNEKVEYRIQSIRTLHKGSMLLSRVQCQLRHTCLFPLLSKHRHLYRGRPKLEMSPTVDHYCHSVV